MIDRLFGRERYLCGLTRGCELCFVTRKHLSLLTEGPHAMLHQLVFAFAMNKEFMTFEAIAVSL